LSIVQLDPGRSVRALRCFRKRPAPNQDPQI